MSLLKICILILLCFQPASSKKRCPSQEAISPCRCMMRGEEYQIWCSHSNLPRVLESLERLSQYVKEPIDEVIIENNILPSMPGRSFGTLKILRLMLRNNSLERVSGDWLAGLEGTLMEIFIVEPRLRSLSDDSLINLHALQAITIQSKVLKRLPLLSGLPNLRYIQVESESLMEISPMVFKNNPKLAKVHINGSSRLTRLEVNLFADLPKLDLINISNCALNLIHPRTLYRLPVLKELSLAGNKFVDIDMIGRSIRELPMLEIIRLDHNYIDKIVEEAFINLPLLKKIYLSNNRITEIHHGAFHRVPSLKTLDLNKNLIRKIHPESFLLPSGSGLEELLLTNNRIGYVKELRSLLEALPRLTYLDMRHNQLEAIPFGALRGHPTLEYINLGHNKLRLIDKEAFMAMPALRELRLKNNSLSEDLHHPFWNLPALKGLDLSENYFRRLEPGFLNNLPSLRRIDLSQNELSYIDPSSFLSTKSLEHINVSHNNLKVIHPATFRHLLHLYELDASYNELQDFIPGLPRGIEYLHLNNNHLKEFPLQPSPDLDLPSLRVLAVSSNLIQNVAKRSLNTLPQLRKLYMGYNLLQTLDESALDGLAHLEVLVLRNNRLVDIHPKSLKLMPDLTTIDLKNNRLDLIPPDLFKSLFKLKNIDLSGNQLAELLPGTLEKNMDVEDVDISSNVLVKLPNTLYGLRNLRKLDLSNNRIKTLDPDVLISLSKIRELRLSRNFIQDLREGVFHNLRHLKELYIDNNEVDNIEPNAIRLLPLLKSIKLSQNKIKEIPNFAFNKLPSLQILSLEENRIRSIAPKAFNIVPRLIFLNLSHNVISDTEEIGLRSLGSIEVLDVSSNKISQLSSGSFDKMDWLVELRMDHNDICGIQGSIFNNMPRLRVLSFKNNKMTSFPEQAVHNLRNNIAVLDIDGNPLQCSCNMLWLQAWLQEASQIGPHCVDGTLLREMTLSRQECPEEKRNAEQSVTSCDVELLTGTGNSALSQAFAKWVNMKNISKGIKNKNELPPTPEESEYFYDDYVDYPINESMVERITMRDKETVTEAAKKMSTTKPLQYITGNTPTLYAATKDQNKVKPNIPSKVNNSPSTSGFTFFGIPLNNLIGGIGRKEDTNTTPIQAQRKSAIVAHNNDRVGMGNIQSNLPYKNNMPAEIINMRPPPLPPPELQGGFLPILPNDGGFKPISDPHLTTSKPGSTTKTVPTNKSLAPTISPEHIIKNKSDTITQTPPSVNIDTGELLTHTTTQKSLENVSLPEQLLENDESLNKTTLKRTTFLQEIHYSSKKTNNTIVPVLESASFTPKTNTSVNTTTTPGTIQDIESSTQSNIELPIVTTTESVQPVRVTETATLASNIQMDVTSAKKTVNSSPQQSIGPKPALLIPGGQQPPFKSGGRSTVTKVHSPHTPESAQLHSHVKELSKLPKYNATRGLGYIPDPQPRREFQKIQDEISYVDKEKNDWYFANYNNTNMEPYVAKITNNGRKNRTYCIVFLFAHFVIVYFQNIN